MGSVVRLPETMSVRQETKGQMAKRCTVESTHMAECDARKGPVTSSAWETIRKGGLTWWFRSSIKSAMEKAKKKRW